MKKYDHQPIATDADRPCVYAATEQDWRDWLEEHHADRKSIWLIIYRKESSVSSVYYPEAVDQALCYGWVDSLPNKRDAHSYYQFFAPRKPKSNWSKVNKEKVARLTAAGLMAPAGLALVAEARHNGAWDALNAVEEGIIPDDLMVALQGVPAALGHFERFPRLARRGILEWILNAKRSETRARRVEETARLAGQNIRANQWPRK